MKNYTIFCCEDMNVNVNETQTIIYNEVFDEYGLKLDEDEVSCILINHCPWCGVRLPESKRDAWIIELEALGFENPLFVPQLPSKYQSSEWRIGKTQPNDS